MFVVRQVRMDDLPILMKLARMVHFVNLPADQETIATKILTSRRSFSGRLEDPERAVYMFIMEDTETGNVVGTSQIVARMGFPESPNTFFTLTTRDKYAKDLQIGATHTIMKLGADYDGPTEIGGLILQPSFRGHKEKLGKQISLIRFHYIGLHRRRFRNELIAEMMAPITAEGTNDFWEYVGRRFINLSYEEADPLSTKSKGFILDLMPAGEIYVSLLPPEARMLIGQVGKDTVPARRMLENLGFEYRHQIDPFDGGPHLHAKTKDIPLVGDTKRVRLAGSCPKSRAKGEAFVSFESKTGFRALQTPYQMSRDGKTISIPREAMAALTAEPEDMLGVTILKTKSRHTAAKPKSRTAKKKTKKKTTKKKTTRRASTKKNTVKKAPAATSRRKSSAKKKTKRKKTTRKS